MLHLFGVARRTSLEIWDWTFVTLVTKILRTSLNSRHGVPLLGDVFGTSSKVFSETMFKMVLSISSGIVAAAD